MRLYNFIRLGLISNSSEISDKDSALVEACKEELPYILTSYEELVRKYEPAVLNSCHYLLGDYEDSEETSQDVFIRVFHHIRKFDQKSTFRTWLYQIVRNCCYTRLKQRERQTLLKKEFSLNSGPGVGKSDNQDNMSVKMEEALGKLSPEEREIIILRFVSELTLSEIAETMETQLSAAKMRLYRTMEKLKKELKQ